MYRLLYIPDSIFYTISMFSHNDKACIPFFGPDPYDTLKFKMDCWYSKDYYQDIISHCKQVGLYIIDNNSKSYLRVPPEDINEAYFELIEI